VKAEENGDQLISYANSSVARLPLIGIVIIRIDLVIMIIFLMVWLFEMNDSSLF